MAEIARDYYQSLHRVEDLNSSLRDTVLNYVDMYDGKRIKSIENQFLQEEIMREEVIRALAQAEKRKSPGVDGIPVEIYQKIEPEIVDLLTEMMNETIDTGRTSRTQ